MSIPRDSQTTEYYIQNFGQIASTTNSHGGLRGKLMAEITNHSDYDEDQIYAVRYTPTKGKYEGVVVTDYFRKGRWVVFFKENAEIKDGKIFKLKRPNNIWNFDSEYKSVGSEGGVKLPNGKKPEKLIQKIVELSTEEGDIVLDFFLGSGTTAAVAHKMKRQTLESNNWTMKKMMRNNDFRM